MTEKSFPVRYENEKSELVMGSDFVTIVSTSKKIRVRYANVRKHFLNRKRMAVKIDLIRGNSVVFHLLGEDKGASLARINDEMVRRLKEGSGKSDDVVVRKKRKRRKGEERILSAIRDEEKEEVRERVQRARKDSHKSRRERLLESDASLRKQYQDLVDTGLVNEEEFWSNIPESRFRDMENVAQVLLDVSTIRDIFSKHPELLKIYQRDVPLKMSDEEFWTKYAISKTFDLHDEDDDEEEEEEKVEEEQDDVLETLNRSSAKEVSLKETIPKVTTTTTSRPRRIEITTMSVTKAVATTMSTKTTTSSSSSSEENHSVPFSYDHDYVFGTSRITPRALTSILSCTPITTESSNGTSFQTEKDDLQKRQRTLSDLLRHLYGTRSVLKRDRILNQLVRLRRSLLQQRSFWSDASMMSIVYQIDKMVAQIDAATRAY